MRVSWPHSATSKSASSKRNLKAGVHPSSRSTFLNERMETNNIMPFLIIGLLIGVPLGAVGGVIGYFKLIAEANEQGARRATWENERRRDEHHQTRQP